MCGLQHGQRRLDLWRRCNLDFYVLEEQLRVLQNGRLAERPFLSGRILVM